ncbi:MAG: YicC family protein [Ignavibacteriae bacterium]|nr:YicC family protein [Ignavibacteriota bacterium]
MLASMTGYGRGEAASRGIHVAVELRSVNSRFLEVSARLPRSLSVRENEIKEIVRKKISRGKVNLLAIVEHENDGDIPVRVNVSAAKGYFKLLNDLRKTVKLRETVKLVHLLQVSEVLEPLELENTDDKEWNLVNKALDQAIDNLLVMKRNEGEELAKDLRQRIGILEDKLAQVEKISAEQIPNERTRLHDRIQSLLEKETIDEGRLEMELALMADRLDVTEECVRFRSHNKFFLEAIAKDDAAGRKLNFLIQEMNREANTIGSKSNAAEIAHLVVNIKEEIERIREQLQNIE